MSINISKVKDGTDHNDEFNEVNKVDDINEADVFDPTDIKFMQRAYELAQQAEQINEIPVGAVVVANGKIIGEGYNQSITLNDPSAHAEMLAIKQAGQSLQNYRILDCTLYVTLEPCPMCAGLLVHSRIKRLVFAAKDLKTGAAGSAFNLVNHEKHNHQIETTQGLLAEQCSSLLSAFFKRRRAEIKAKKKAKKASQL
jgi:tRNA(adenine34) deaminase